MHALWEHLHSSCKLSKTFQVHYTDILLAVLIMLLTILWLMKNIRSDSLYLPAASAVMPMVPLLVLFQPALWSKWQIPRKSRLKRLLQFINSLKTIWEKVRHFLQFLPAINSEFQAQKSPTLLVVPAHWCTLLEATNIFKQHGWVSQHPKHF